MTMRRIIEMLTILVGLILAILSVLLGVCIAAGLIFLIPGWVYSNIANPHIIHLIIMIVWSTLIFVPAGILMMWIPFWVMETYDNLTGINLFSGDGEETDND